jgi:hypothetical protein
MDSEIIFRIALLFGNHDAGATRQGIQSMGVEMSKGYNPAATS